MKRLIMQTMRVNVGMVEWLASGFAAANMGREMQISKDGEN